MDLAIFLTSSYGFVREDHRWIKAQPGFINREQWWHRWLGRGREADPKKGWIKGFSFLIDFQ